MNDSQNDTISVEASELGWEPGYWPRTLKFGGGFYLAQTAIVRVNDGEREIVGWNYMNTYTGHKLIVWND